MEYKIDYIIKIFDYWGEGRFKENLKPMVKEDLEKMYGEVFMYHYNKPKEWFEKQLKIIDSINEELDERKVLKGI